MNVAVIGGYNCSKKAYKSAQRLGVLIAQERWILICGGGSGVMEAACKGAKEKGGLTVGILPSFDEKEANLYLDVKIPTGLGCARNILVVRAADAIVAVNGKYGTLSEIAFALNEGKRVCGIDTWDIKGLIKVTCPEEAIKYIKRKPKWSLKEKSFSQE
ncbi:MAG: TIGR00725 family protein [Candidatus Omnitrophota bacterium]|nr:MAG: TIGR00725 family protein [Candidatus Omnitrophota bacterium]